MTSLKKLIAVLAVSLPFLAKAQAPAAAAAPAPLFQWYGTLNVNAQWTEASDPTAVGTAVNVSGRVGVSTDSTNIGIRGTADLGKFGLGAIYQCETSANIDGVGVSGICNRNSRLGLTSPVYGTLFYGNWDSPYKAVWYGTKGDDPFGNTDVYDAAGIMGSPGFKTRSTASGSAAAFTASQTPTTFNVRAANSIAYHSPKIFGLTVKAQHSTNEFASNSGDISPNLWSVSGNYERGPLSVFAAYERHDDYFGLNVIAGNAAAPLTKTNVDTGVRVGAGYELASPFGATTIGATYEWLDYSQEHTVAGQLESVSRSAVMVGAKHRMGNHEFRLRYAYADGLDTNFNGNGPGAVGSGAQQYAIGYAYHLTKAAQAYAYFTKIENERNATYTFATAGVAAVTGNFTAGADPMALGLGMRYAF